VLADHQLIVPEVVAEEVRRVLVQKIRVSDDDLASFEAVLERCEIVQRSDTPSPIPIRDPDDELVLASAIAGRCRILVTGDDDLLSVAQESPIPILSPRAFLTLLRSGAS